MMRRISACLTPPRKHRSWVRATAAAAAAAAAGAAAAPAHNAATVETSRPLEAWLRQHGATVGPVRFGPSALHHRGDAAVATEVVAQAGHLLLQLPPALVLTAARAEQVRLPSSHSQLVGHRLSTHTPRFDTRS
jgi:hypothetical protein